MLISVSWCFEIANPENEPWWERTHRNGLLWGPDILGLGSNFELLQMFDGIEMGVGAGVLV